MNTSETAVCRCDRCGSDIEFDPATFQSSHQSSSTDFGQTIECPHCGLKAQLTRHRPTPAGSAGEMALFIIGGVLCLWNVFAGIVIIALGLILNAVRRRH